MSAARVDALLVVHGKWKELEADKRKRDADAREKKAKMRRRSF